MNSEQFNLLPVFTFYDKYNEFQKLQTTFLGAESDERFTVYYKEQCLATSIHRATTMFSWQQK